MSYMWWESPFPLGRERLSIILNNNRDYTHIFIFINDCQCHKAKEEKIIWKHQLYKAREVEVNVGTFRHYSLRKPKTKPSIYHQPSSYSENLYKEDTLPEGLFDLIVFSSTSLLLAIFCNLYNSLCVHYATDYLHIRLKVRIKEIHGLRHATDQLLYHMLRHAHGSELFCHTMIHARDRVPRSVVLAGCDGTHLVTSNNWSVVTRIPAIQLTKSSPTPRTYMFVQLKFWCYKRTYFLIGCMWTCLVGNTSLYLSEYEISSPVS
jgi:hypothetical protein